MKNIYKNLCVALVVAALFLSVTFRINATSENKFTLDGNIDTTRISTVTFTVIGMDSSSVSVVQDRLKATEGVNFNFACWTDTIVFVEYDTVLTNPGILMKTINELGYNAKIRED